MNIRRMISKAAWLVQCLNVHLIALALAVGHGEATAMFAGACVLLLVSFPGTTRSCLLRLFVIYRALYAGLLLAAFVLGLALGGLLLLVGSIRRSPPTIALGYAALYYSIGYGALGGLFLDILYYPDAVEIPARIRRSISTAPPAAGDESLGSAYREEDR